MGSNSDRRHVGARRIDPALGASGESLFSLAGRYAPSWNSSNNGLTSAHLMKNGGRSNKRPHELFVGAFVRVQLPGHRMRRPYRVVKVEGGAVALRELWRNSDTPARPERGGVPHAWVEGNDIRLAAMDRLEGLELIDDVSPEPGTPSDYPVKID